jgi:CheY-like chemotaxis protein
LEKVLLAGNRARDLVAQILAFSRHTKSKQINLEPQPVIKEATKLLRSSIPTTIKITLKVDDDCGMIHADPTQFHQIIMNLCTNSYQAMEKQGGTLFIGLERTELTVNDFLDNESMVPGSYLKFTVSDTGPGIEKAVQDLVFDPYFTTKEIGKGTGMGLAVVHGIVKNHGGMISFKSSSDEGTTFHVFLPELKEAKEEDTKEPQTGPIATGEEHILLVDDEALLVDMGKHLLERLGYRVTAMTSSTVALEFIRKQDHQVDLVITDQTMPGLTGAELSREILSIHTEMPIILCTGYSSIMTRKKALNIGVRELVMKPMVRKDIALLIRQILDGEYTGMC